MKNIVVATFPFFLLPFSLGLSTTVAGAIDMQGPGALPTGGGPSSAIAPAGLNWSNLIKCRRDAGGS